MILCSIWLKVSNPCTPMTCSIGTRWYNVYLLSMHLQVSLSVCLACIKILIGTSWPEYYFRVDVKIKTFRVIADCITTRASSFNVVVNWRNDIKDGLMQWLDVIKHHLKLRQDAKNCFLIRPSYQKPILEYPLSLKRDMSKILTNLAHYERLLEGATMLELCLWKAKIDESRCGLEVERPSKKLKVDDTDFRKNCRISCGAEHVIGNVLPFLLPGSK